MEIVPRRYQTRMASIEKLPICSALNVQVGDFGSARSATSEGYHWAEQGPPNSSSDAVLLKSRRQVTFSVHAHLVYCCGNQQLWHPDHRL